MCYTVQNNNHYDIACHSRVLKINYNLKTVLIFFFHLLLISFTNLPELHASLLYVKN